MSEALLEEVRLERLIPVSPELLFALWIDPAQLAKWWAPDGYEMEIDTLEMSPGGRWRNVLRGADGGGIAVGGVFRVVDPPRRLAFSWAWEDERGAPGHETEVTVTFDPAPGGARLVVLHQRFATAADRARHDSGWAASLDRLARLAGE
jgi:uncharacterized protein YndB with AHSA1/START domain